MDIDYNYLKKEITTTKNAAGVVVSTITKEYEIGTGPKGEFYTLWLFMTVDLIERDEKGEIIEAKRKGLNSLGTSVMDFFVHHRFIQNLGKTKAAALEKAKALGVNCGLKDFNFDLKKWAKPSVKAFGATLKHKKNQTKNYWIAEATPEFWAAWKTKKDKLKACGWNCWKAPKGVWYMIQNDNFYNNI